MPNTITSELLKWFNLNKRDLPWRKTKDPYFIWLSEIIFQQTRISQGIDYYLRFEEKFKNVFSLAEASEDEVLKLWQGLGYYSRARNMLKTARQIVEENKGVFPSDINELLKFKGIGVYTASVILSVCFDKSYAVIDGNVNRLISRLYNIHDFIDIPKGQKLIKDKADKLIDPKHPGDYNEAMMDFGAMICTPQNPQCNICPLQKFCLAYERKTMGDLPKKSPKRDNKQRAMHYFLVNVENGILLKQRTEKDIWHNLFDLPMIELIPDTDIRKEQLTAYFGEEILFFKLINKIKHKLTHQELSLHFYKVEVDKIPNGFLTVSLTDLNKYAVPKPIENFLKSYVQLPE